MGYFLHVRAVGCLLFFVMVTRLHLLTHLLRGDGVNLLDLSEGCFYGSGSGQWHLLIGGGVITEVLPPGLAVMFTRRSLKQVPNIRLIKVDEIGCQVHVDCFTWALFLLA